MNDHLDFWTQLEASSSHWADPEGLDHLLAYSLHVPTTGLQTSEAVIAAFRAVFFAASVPEAQECMRSLLCSAELKHTRKEFKQAAAAQKKQLLTEVDALIHSSPEVLLGEPVFRGTRVPVRTIGAWLDAGTSPEKIRESYPNISDQMMLISCLYLTTHPNLKAPTSGRESSPAWSLKRRCTVKLKSSSK